MTGRIKRKPQKENLTQRDAFLSYFQLGEKRSLEWLRQEYANAIPKREVSLATLKSWCKKFKWVERVQSMDQAAMEKSEELMIKEATLKKSDILNVVRNTMIKYNEALLADKKIPDASDFKKMWEIMRIELGKTIGQDTPLGLTPVVNIFLTKNEKIVKVVQQAQEDLRKALEGEIKEDD